MVRQPGYPASIGFKADVFSRIRGKWKIDRAGVTISNYNRKRLAAAVEPIRSIFLPGEMKHDQRQAPRKSLHTDAIITIDGLPLKVKTMDVSAGGLSINAGKQLAVGKNCHVKFDMPIHGEMHTVAASAQLVYCFFVGDAGFKVGLQFMTLHSDGAAAIAEYMAS